MKTIMEKLRFAPVIRVSTEKQEKQGESLNTQKTQIIQYINYLGGVIPDNCWKYAGQEHATANHERKLLDMLLSDSSKNIFDAVICVDASRWSRDNLKSKEGLQILRDNNIKFFVGTTEFDLFNPSQNLFLGMSAEIGEYQAREQSRKSILSRIERARQGRPATGKIPYGRVWDEKNGWSLDPLKADIIKQAAERYLSGESLTDIANSYNMNMPNLHKVLTKRSGSEWECKFEQKNINISEKVIVTIPALLDEETIQRILEKAKANKTFTHGIIKYNYLLSRMIFCSKCGYAMFGFTNHSDKRYYRHSRYKGVNCKHSKFVIADEIENAVLIHLIQTFGDITRINNAIKQATPDLNKIEILIKEKEKYISELKKIAIQKDNLINSVAEGVFLKEDIQSKMSKLKERELSINTRVLSIDNELSNIPDPTKVKKLTELGIRVLKDATKNPKLIFKKDYVWKRNLVENAFNGVDSQGKRLGVYMEETEEGFVFEIRGTLERTLLNLPLTDDYLINTFQLDSDYQDIYKELDNIRNNMKTKFALHLPDISLLLFRSQ